MSETRYSGHLNSRLVQIATAAAVPDGKSSYGGRDEHGYEWTTEYGSVNRFSQMGWDLLRLLLILLLVSVGIGKAFIIVSVE